MTIEGIQTAKQSEQVLLARGIYVLGSNVSFRILLKSFLKKIVVLLRHMCIASGTGAPERIVELKLNDGLKPKMERSMLHYNQIDNLQTQIERHRKNKLEGAEQMVHDWKKPTK